MDIIIFIILMNKIKWCLWYFKNFRKSWKWNEKMKDEKNKKKIKEESFVDNLPKPFKCGD